MASISLFLFDIITLCLYVCVRMCVYKQARAVGWLVGWFAAAAEFLQLLLFVQIFGCETEICETRLK